MSAAIKWELKNLLVEAEGIPERAFNDFYFFFQKNKALLCQVEYDSYFKIKLRFLNALYSMDDYALFQEEANTFLSEILNVGEFNKEYKEYYFKVLLLKARAFANENKTEQALEIYHALAQLQPGNKPVFRKLLQLHFQIEFYKNQRKLKWITALILAFILLNACLIFFIYPFYPEYAEQFSGFRNGLFGFSLILFVWFQAYNAWSAKKAIREKMLLMEERRKEQPLITRC